MATLNAMGQSRRGGTGALMAEILNAYLSMHGVVADISSVVKQAKTEIRARGLDARFTGIECDFSNEIPTEESISVVEAVRV